MHRTPSIMSRGLVQQCCQCLRRPLHYPAMYRPARFFTATASPRDIEQSISDLQQETRASLSQHDYSSALTAATTCLEVTEAHFGKVHAATACAINNIGQVHRQAGDVKGALPFLVDALEAYEKACGLEHVSTGQAMANLGLLHLALAPGCKGMERVEHVEDGRALLERALECKRKALGERHAQVGVAMYQLASALRAQKKYGEAERLLLASIALLREVEGKGALTTSTALNNAGFLFKERGEYLKAKAFYREALDIRHAKLGEKHPDSIATRHNVAECLRASGDEEGAQQIQREILALFPPKAAAGASDAQQQQPLR